MRKPGYGWTLAFIICIYSCKDSGWKKSDNGILFKSYISHSGESIAGQGNTVKFNYTILAGDSIVATSVYNLPSYQTVDSAANGELIPSSILYGLQAGDSIVLKQLCDSVIKAYQLSRIDGRLKKKRMWFTCVKLLDVFSSDSAVVEDQKASELAAMEMQIARGKKRLEQYFFSNGIKSAELMKGLYLEPIKTGDGIKPLSYSDIELKYTLKDLHGNIRNRRTNDSKPVQLKLGTGMMPEVIEAAILYCREGDKVRIYLPAVLLFGLKPTDNDINLDDDFVIEAELVKVGVTD